MLLGKHSLEHLSIALWIYRVVSASKTNNTPLNLKHLTQTLHSISPANERIGMEFLSIVIRANYGTRLAHFNSIIIIVSIRSTTAPFRQDNIRIIHETTTVSCLHWQMVAFADGESSRWWKRWNEKPTANLLQIFRIRLKLNIIIRYFFSILIRDTKSTGNTNYRLHFHLTIPNHTSRSNALHFKRLKVC